MSLKTIIISFFGINLAFAAAVFFLFNDPTAKSDAIIWVIYCNVIFLIAAVITIIRKKRGTE